MFVMAWGADLLSYSDSRQGGQALVVTPCWFHLLTLFGAGAKMASRWYGQACSAVTLQVGQSTWVELLPALRWGGRLQTPSIMEHCLRSQRASTIPPPSPLYTLVCCAEAVHSTLSCFSREIPVCIGEYLSVLMGGGEFSDLLCPAILDLCHFRSPVLLF